jgi:hypothetical protein
MLSAPPFWWASLEAWWCWPSASWSALTVSRSMHVKTTTQFLSRGYQMHAFCDHSCWSDCLMLGPLPRTTHVNLPATTCESPSHHMCESPSHHMCKSPSHHRCRSLSHHA